MDTHRLDALLDELTKIAQTAPLHDPNLKVRVEGDPTITKEKLKRLAKIVIPSALALGVGGAIGAPIGSKLRDVMLRRGSHPLAATAARFAVPISGAIGAGLLVQKKKLLEDIFRKVQGGDSRQQAHQGAGRR